MNDKCIKHVWCGNVIARQLDSFHCVMYRLLAHMPLIASVTKQYN